MTDTIAQIEGIEKLSSIFSDWPLFHDAEVTDFHFSRGATDTQLGDFDGPTLTVRIHAWLLTDQVDARGYLVRRHHTLATLRFYVVDEFEMAGFNRQNAIFGLTVTQKSAQRFACRRGLDLGSKRPDAVFRRGVRTHARDQRHVYVPSHRRTRGTAVQRPRGP